MSGFQRTNRPKRPYREPEPVADTVKSVLRGIRGPQSGALSRVREAWPRIVGLPAARRTRLLELKQGVLTVAIESAALKHHLATMLREEIRAGLSRHLPAVAIREVRYRVGRLS